jgi:hypothetical protein
MSILSVIKAPLGVQLNRVAFLLYSILFTWPVWSFGLQNIVMSGMLLFEGFIFCSVLGLFYTFVRARRARWVLAVLGILIPAVFWSLMSFDGSTWGEWWWWPLEAVDMMGIPVCLVMSLFGKKESAYFTSGLQHESQAA